MGETPSHPDFVDGADLADVDQHLRARLERLLVDHTQSEIARKTGTTRSNVNRYAHGAAIPGSFLAALVPGLHVNPVWLLSGKGDPYSTDVSPATQTSAQELLRLFEAMSAVERVKLGAVSSRLHLKALHDLRESMRKFQNVRTVLTDKLKPALQQLTGEMKHALERGKIERATNARESAKLIAEFCDDSGLILEYDILQAELEFQRGRKKSATALQRRAFVRASLAGNDFAIQAAQSAYHLVRSLLAAGQYAEARGMAEAARALIPQRTQSLDAMHRLNVLYAEALMELRDLNGANRIIHTVLSQPELEGSTRSFAMDYSVKAMCLGGGMPYESIAPTSNGGVMRAELALTYACWTARVEQLNDACSKHLDQPSAQPSFKRAALHARALHDAISGVGTTEADFERVSHDILTHHPEDEAILSFELAVAKTQIASASGDSTAAGTLALDAHDRLEDMPRGISPPFLLKAIHCRNILTVAATNPKGSRFADLITFAHAFVSEHREHGYNCLVNNQ